MACGRFPTPTPGPAASTQVVIVSQAGKLTTATPIGGKPTVLPPTPTFDPSFNSLLTPLASDATGTAAAVSPTALTRPSRTPAPSATPFPTLEPPPGPPLKPTFENPPTRTPSPPTTTPVPRNTLTPTRTATTAPADPTGDNSDLAHSLAVDVGKDSSGQLTTKNGTDVFSFDVAEDDAIIFVTLTGKTIERYRLFLISPGRQQAAAGREVGRVARQIRFPARSEKGTWFVEVSTDGKGVPDGPYTLRVDVRAPTPGAG
jgi:hypothetical protein